MEMEIKLYYSSTLVIILSCNLLGDELRLESSVVIFEIDVVR